MTDKTITLKQLIEINKKNMSKKEKCDVLYMPPSHFKYLKEVEKERLDRRKIKRETK